MKPLNEKESRQHARGPVHYVLTVGVLFWGLTVALASSVVNAFMDREKGGFLAELGGDLPTALVVYPAVGILVGALMWRSLDKRNRQTLN